MTTIRGFSENLPNMVNENIINQLMGKLDPELKSKMLACGGQIKVDMESRAWNVVCDGNPELEEQIIADLKSKSKK